jgi:hypothetical protein
MDYIITILISIVSGVLVFILQQVVRENRDLKRKKDAETELETVALRNGMRQLLSDRLEELYDQYCEVDTIPRRAYDRWMKLHAAYKGLRGNGTIDRMKEEIETKHITNDYSRMRG